jgi:inward rectifier potassium channel
MIRKDGTIHFKVSGLPFFKKWEIHNILLSLPWVGFIGVVFTIYLVTNTIFTLLFLYSGATGLSGTNLINSGDRFVKVFYFSAQTLCTGYFTDTIPVSIRSTSLAAIEAVFGLFLFALITGLLYSRFAKPNSKILFSDKIIIRPYKEGTALLIRMANIKRNQLLKVDASAILMMHIERNGVKQNVFYDLKLEQESIAMLLLTWTMVHIIDDNSPLNTFSVEDIIECHGEIIVVIEGSDDILSQSVFARTSFGGHDILTGYKFEELTHMDNQNVINIDIRKMNQYSYSA